MLNYTQLHIMQYYAYTYVCGECIEITEFHGKVLYKRQYTAIRCHAYKVKWDNCAKAYFVVA